MHKEEKGSMKPDKNVHKNCNMGTEAKDSKVPGQMYVPKTTHKSSDFVGEKK